MDWDWDRFAKVTCNDISVINRYVKADRCAGGPKKLDLRSGSQRHRHFVEFFNVPVQAPTRNHPFYGYSKKPPPFQSPFTTRMWIRRTYCRLNPPGSQRGKRCHGKRTVLAMVEYYMYKCRKINCCNNFSTNLWMHMQCITNRHRIICHLVVEDTGDTRRILVSHENNGSRITL